MAAYAPCHLSSDQAIPSAECWIPDGSLAIAVPARDDRDIGTGERPLLRRARFLSLSGEDGLSDAEKLLEGALKTGHRAPEVHNDLAAARLALAGLQGSAMKLVLAHEAAARALEIDPSMPEAQFNLALSLQRLSLWSAAERAWSNALKLRDEPAYLDEVLERLSALQFRAANSPVPEASVDTTAVMDRYRSALQEWSHGRVAGIIGGSSGSLERARAIAMLAADDLGDRSLLTAVDDLVLAAGPADPALTGLRLMGDASQALEVGCSDADSDLSSAWRLLSRTTNPLVHVIGLELAECHYYASHYAGASELLEGILDEAQRKGFGLLAARAGWLLGTTKSHQGDLEAALSHYRRAASYYQGVRDTGRAAFLEVLIGRILSKLNLEEEAWNKRLQALRVREAIARRDRLFTLFQDASQSLDQQAHYYTALEYRHEQVRVSRTTDPADSDLEPFALIERAGTYLKMGRTKAALVDLRAAKRLVSRMPLTHNNRDRVEAKLNALRARLWAPTSPGAALLAAEDALMFFRGSDHTGGDRLHVLEMYRTIAAIHMSQADSKRATAALEEGFKMAQELRTSVREPRLKVRFLEQYAALTDEIVALQLEAGRHTDALLSLDRSVNRLVLDEETARYADTPTRGRFDETNLDADTAVLVLHSLPDRLARWVVSQGSVSYDQVWIDRSDLVERMLQEDAADTLFDVFIPEEVRSFSALALIPVGDLAGFSFASLVTPDTASPLIGSHSIVRLPNLRPLWFEGPAHRDHQEGTALLFVAQPVGSEAPLPGLQKEVDGLRSIYPRLEIARSPAVPETKPSPTITHFAGHAYVDPSDPFRGRLGSGEASLSFLDILRTPSIAASTVVLAGCNTASRGLLKSGEDASLAIAFLSAGAENVVASLGSVVDDETTELTLDFHRRLAKGASPFMALREAQLRSLNKGGSAWRDFVLITSRIENLN